MSKARDLADAGNFDFPASDGTAGQVLETDGSGNLSFVDAGGGKVLQVVDTYYTGTTSQAISGNTQTTINAFSASITPSSTSSKILVIARWNGESSFLYSHDALFGLTRDTTFVGDAPAAGDRMNSIQPYAAYYDSNAASTIDSVHFHYLDSPATTSSVTYKLNFIISDACTLYTNRSVEDSNTITRERLTSGITLMEIAG